MAAYKNNSQFKASLEKLIGKDIDVWVQKDGPCSYEAAATVGAACDQGYFYGYAESRSQAYRKVLEKLAAGVEAQKTTSDEISHHN